MLRFAMEVEQKTEESAARIRKTLGFDGANNPGSNWSGVPKPKTAGGQSTKMDVLVNSMAVFAAKGVTDTTVQNLLDAAKVSRRTFYKYFKNKVDVLESIYKVSIDILIVRFKSEMSQAETLSDVVNRCVDIYFDYHVELGSIIRLMQEEAMSSDSPLAPHRLESQKAIAQIFDREMMRLQNSKLDPWAFYAFIWAVENASLYLLTNTECTESDVSRCKNVMRSFIGRLLINDTPPQLPFAPNEDNLFNR